MQQHVMLNLPADWRTVHTALVPAREMAGWTAADYDELVDSPILAGNAEAFRFELDGQDYALINEGDTTLWDGTQAAQDVASVVKAVQSFWGVDPLEREYLFLNLLVEGRGGLEHDHSTVMLASHWQMRYREDYVRWLALVTHEFFHAWNVRRMRPQALASYDYDSEVYTRELWLAEGLTSYYDNLLLFRSGLITVSEFLELLADEIHKLDTTPGRKVRSLELASFDTWIKHYQPDANSINSTVSYYRKGSVVGFIIDTRLRSQSSNKLSLDAVMREMYRQYGNSSYPPGAFEALIEQLAGPETGSWVRGLLAGTAELDLDAALDWYGLELDRGASHSDTVPGSESATAGFGLTWDKSNPLLVVESVIRGGAGANAGVLPGDELLAINGSRVQKGQISDRMIRLVAGEQVELTLVRYGQLFTLPLIVQNAIPETYVISLKPKFRERNRRRMELWLGRDLMLTN
jgi:predicted metalloprotease with PDZ domain